MKCFLQLKRSVLKDMILLVGQFQLDLQMLKYGT